MVKLIELYKTEYMGQPQYVMYYQEDNGEPVKVLPPRGKWDRSVIIDSLVRSKYAQDEVEAIINNHFLNIAEWLDAKFAGSTDKFIDEEYDNMQAWRKECKFLADEALAKYPAI